jgi:hypothetical protein
MAGWRRFFTESEGRARRPGRTSSWNSSDFLDVGWLKKGERASVEEERDGEGESCMLLRLRGFPKIQRLQVGLDGDRVRCLRSSEADAKTRSNVRRRCKECGGVVVVIVSSLGSEV